MADLKKLGINTDFDKEFFYECLNDICKSFQESYKNYKETKNSFDEIEVLHYLGELKRTTEMFEEEGAKEDEKLKEYYKFRKDHYGY